MEIENKIKQIICISSREDIEVNDINYNTVLTDDLGFDSIQIVQMTVELENTFGIEFDDDDFDIDNLILFMNLKKIVEKKLEQKDAI